MFKYIDIHAHLDMPAFDKDREDLILQMQRENIGTITIAVDKQSSFRAVELAKKYENVFAAVGFHPTDADENFIADDFAEIIKEPKVVVVGECGLDFFRLKKGDFETEKKKQQKLFEDQIDFAIEHDKPLMVHCRDAHTEVIDILRSKKKEFGEKLRGDIHFFSGDTEIAKQYFDLDFSISFGGVLTFTKDYDEVVKYAPLEKIMSETDAPFVAPKPHRGERNNPLFVKYIAKRIAEIRQANFDIVQQTLVQNAVIMFALKG